MGEITGGAPEQEDHRAVSAQSCKGDKLPFSKGGRDLSSLESVGSENRSTGGTHKPGKEFEEGYHWPRILHLGKVAVRKNAKRPRVIIDYIKNWIALESVGRNCLLGMETRVGGEEKFVFQKRNALRKEKAGRKDGNISRSRSTSISR